MTKLIYIFIILTLVSCSEEPKVENKKSPTDPVVIDAELDGSDTILTVKYFYPSGKVRSITKENTHRQKHGFEKSFFENGIQKYEIYFIGNNTPWGVGKGCSITGDTLDLGTLAFGVGSFNDYYDNGTPKAKGFYKDSKQDSLWTFFYPSGKVEREVNFKGGLQNGLFKRYFENGKLDYYAEWEYGNCIISKDYFESGNIFKIIKYKNGKMHGQAVEYYDSPGKIRQTRVFEYGRENGVVMHYNISGKLESKSMMRDGEYVDTMYLYNDKGKVIDTKIIKPKGQATTTHI